jgi:PAP2 superfamily
MSIEIINDLSMRLVADDYSDGHGKNPNQAGPTKTARAMAIIHLAAHDAYARVTGAFAPNMGGLQPKPAGSASTDAAGTTALLAAGFRAAERLYPDFAATVAALRPAHTGSDPALEAYGVQIADTWVDARAGDGSAEIQLDTNYDRAPGRHRPDPFNPGQPTLGRAWGAVKPFVIADVATDAPLGPPPNLTDQQYTAAYKEVIVDGSANLTERGEKSRHMAAVGIFWGYDGSNKLGTPPRLYNQVVRAIPQLDPALPQALPHPKRGRLLTAVNAAMADAGIAAWHWKYQYDFWRPIVGIREADAEWGPTGAGDGNAKTHGNPFWRPLGAPRSNPITGAVVLPLAPSDNFTPNFPAYPSGHATFGTAAFETAAKLLGKKPKDVTVTFASDEFNGTTADHNGVARPRWKPAFTLQSAIEDNSVSRIFLGVHWKFDAEGGEAVGRAIAKKAAAAFP